jgi:peptide chain release factor 2
MLLDELKEELKSVEPSVEAIKSFYQHDNVEAKFKDLDEQLHQPDSWQHPDQIKISKEHQRIKHLVESYEKTIKTYEEFNELLDLFGDNEEELQSLQLEIKTFCKKVHTFKLELLLNKEEDSKNCFLSINAGAGGTESQDWTEILLRMYVRFCEREKFAVDILDYQTGEEAGIKSATLFIKKTNAFGFLKSESGIHRLVRISPFDSNKRRHTSFAAVTVTPEASEEKVEIDEKDLRIDTYRAGGAGGQHVNKTDSAVRITHIPSGIVVQCQNERSQLQNKQTSMKMLMAKLVEKQEREKKEKENALEKKKIEWGSQIRSYVLHPYKMVKDHRTNIESPQPDLVLDGDIMGFIEGYLVSQDS